jgi:hypothetical protein
MTFMASLVTTKQHVPAPGFQPRSGIPPGAADNQKSLSRHAYSRNLGWFRVLASHTDVPTPAAKPEDVLSEAEGHPSCRGMSGKPDTLLRDVRFKASSFGCLRPAIALE